MLTIVQTAASTTTTPVETLSPTLYFTVTETATTTTPLNVQATETNTRTVTVSTGVDYVLYSNFALRAGVNNRTQGPGTMWGFCLKVQSSAQVQTAT
jgi:hypothetical protein